MNTTKKYEMPTVVDIHKVNGERPEFDLYIGRRVRFHKIFTKDSKWGNRFYKDLEGYEQHIREDLWDDLDELEGKRLGCWCITTSKLEPVECHGQILMKLFKEKKENESPKLEVIELTEDSLYKIGFSKEDIEEYKKSQQKVAKTIDKLNQKRG